MSVKNQKEIHRRMDLGIKQGVAKALQRHKDAGQSVVVLENGKIKEIPPEKIPDYSKI